MRYVEQSESEILDTKTNLVWKNAYETNSSFDEAHAYAKRESVVTGHQWRVPTIKELHTLVDRSISNPATEFPGMPPVWFWSSSPYVGNTYFAWFVNFLNGNVDYSSRYDGYAVRMVRGG